MLDWAGTTVDHGSLAPVLALQALFDARGITLSAAQARREMGLLKRDHIQAILAQPEVNATWTALNGSRPTDADVSSLFDQFGPLQMEIIGQHSQLIPAVAESVADWQRRGLRIGTTTGYTRAMLAPVLEQAAQQGYHPDASVCPDEAPAGRPAPWMLFKNCQLLEVYPPAACVKIGDTVVDILEGRNAGMWTIGLTRTGNLVGLTEEEWVQLPAPEQAARLARAGQILLDAGADFIAEDLPSCDPLLMQIEARICARD
jgi:phosphonoacetaldehyde hydrolase